MDSRYLPFYGGLYGGSMQPYLYANYNGFGWPFGWYGGYPFKGYGVYPFMGYGGYPFYGYGYGHKFYGY